MTKRNFGYVLVAAGLILAVAGLAGLALYDMKEAADPVPTKEQTTSPASHVSSGTNVTQSGEETPAPTQEQPAARDIAFFDGIKDNPDASVYAAEKPGVPVTGAPAFFQLTGITVHSTENPATGAASDALKMELSAVPDRVFAVYILVEAGEPPVTGTPDDLYGLQWVLTFTSEEISKSARLVEPGQISDQISDGFNTRYQGLGDHAEIEFFGEPGTHYFAVLFSDGTYCSLVLP